MLTPLAHCTVQMNLPDALHSGSKNRILEGIRWSAHRLVRDWHLGRRVHSPAAEHRAVFADTFPLGQRTWKEEKRFGRRKTLWKKKYIIFFNMF